MSGLDKSQTTVTRVTVNKSTGHIELVREDGQTIALLDGNASLTVTSYPRFTIPGHLLPELIDALRRWQDRQTRVSLRVPDRVLPLLIEGRTVVDVMAVTNCSRQHVTQAAVGAGLLINPDTDRAQRPEPDDASVNPIRAWGRANGWPMLSDHGTYPKGLIAAYQKAHQ